MVPTFNSVRIRYSERSDGFMILFTFVLADFTEIPSPILMLTQLIMLRSISVIITLSQCWHQVLNLGLCLNVAVNYALGIKSLDLPLLSWKSCPTK